MVSKIICVIVGYFIGALVQGGYWLGKIHHIDIRNYGSGNAGTTNVMRTLGKKAGFLTYFLDAFKPIFMALLVHFIFGNKYGNEALLVLYGGIGIVLGHNFPFYLNFKGGKGIAATSGVVISYMLFPQHCWSFTLVGGLSFFLIVFTTKYVSLGSLVGITAWFIQFLIWGFIGWLPMSAPDIYEAYIIVFIIVVLGYVRHRGNIVRLINKTERKIGQKKNNV